MSRLLMCVELGDDEAATIGTKARWGRPAERSRKIVSRTGNNQADAQVLRRSGDLVHERCADCAGREPSRWPQAPSKASMPIEAFRCRVSGPIPPDLSIWRSLDAAKRFSRPRRRRFHCGDRVQSQASRWLRRSNFDEVTCAQPSVVDQVARDGRVDLRNAIRVPKQMFIVALGPAIGHAKPSVSGSIVGDDH